MCKEVLNENNEEIIKENNVTKCYYKGNLLLTITELGNDNYIVENSDTRLKGFCRKFNDYKVEYRLDENSRKGKNGRWYNTKKLFQHNGQWFWYILQEYGFVPEILCSK
jgi:hypothetical protein